MTEGSRWQTGFVALQGFRALRIRPGDRLTHRLRTPPLYSADIRIPSAGPNVSFHAVAQSGPQRWIQCGKMLPVNTTVWVKELIELDELQAATDVPAPEEPSPKA